ncbi:MAG: toprim domain-containing protein [Candidatus Hydrogenedentes bacterium]|nr:toprim domain-containing protein [Candidatus Hydrogenedentota bacterium]
MPRIPDAEIDRIKRETDLAALVRSRGVELHKHGSKDFAGKCPFHQDDQPSFIVSPEKGLFHCMGCGAAGNAIQFVEKFDGVSFRHAFEILNAGPAAFSPPADAPLKKATVPRLDSPLDTAADDAALMGQVVDYYHERLLKSPAALDYLRGRGLCHDEALRAFRLGLSDRTLGLRIPAMNRKEGEAIRTRLQRLGIYRENGREHMNGRVVLPIPGPDGRTKLYGRLFSKPNPGAPKHLYLPGPHEGIWNAEALDTGEVILCEAPFDALTFWVNGFKNVTFIYGTEGFTDELFDAIRAKKVRRVRIAYDADEAGNRAAARDAERLTAHGVEVFRVKFPWGMDANEYAQKVQPPGKALQTVLNAAEWVGGTVGQRPTSPPPDAPPVAAAAAEPSHAPTRAPSSESLAADVLAADEKKPPQPALAAPPKPVAPEAVALERVGEYHVMRLGHPSAGLRAGREYRVGGLEKNNSLEVLKVAVRLRYGEAFHLDSFDMAQDGQRRRFIERAAEETGLEKDLIKRDIGRLLLALEATQADRINTALEPSHAARPHELSAEDRAEALAFLKSPDLVERIGAAFDACGLVGEDANRLAAYLACTSRKLDKPLAVIIQSTSAAGKSTLMEAVLAMFPEEERVKYSAMTGQSLYYLGETDLKHKILAIVEEEGAEKASYALKLLQSEGELTIASTGKDPTTGRMETQEYHVEGPVMLFLTTTAVDIDEELLNRCLILTVDESREQTERIHALQRKARSLEGLRLKKRRQTLLALLRNVQRLLRPLDVVNPWADELTFTADRTRTRRDHEKYLTLMDAIALLHQHQRPVDRDPESGEFIRVTLDDIALANRLAPELLGRTLDELPPQTRRLLEAVKQTVKARRKERDVEQSLALFSRRDLQAASGWSYSQVKRHLFRLQELEYVAPRFGRMGATLKYELLIDADEPSETAHIGLLDVEKLRLRHPTLTGPEATLTPPCQTPLARLSPARAGTSVNLATLPARESGAPAVALA